jgi:hypothetical protein
MSGIQPVPARPSLALKVATKIEGWFATSFWVDTHYALAALGTLEIFVDWAIRHNFDAGFATFVGGMWVTAVGNDKLNMPSV